MATANLMAAACGAYALLLACTCCAAGPPYRKATVEETAGSHLCTHAADFDQPKLRAYAEEQFGVAIREALGSGVPQAWAASSVADLAMTLVGGNIDLACNKKNKSNGGCYIPILTNMNAHMRLCGNDWPPFGFTMVGLQRLVNVAQLVSSVVAAGVQGDFAELGVWRGGVCIMAQRLFSLLEPSNMRKIHAFDAFEKLPGYGSASAFLENSATDVQNNFKTMGAWTRHVKFHVGLFQETARAFRAEHDVARTRLAILRIDGNFYDSYQDALYQMYEYVPVGGYVIFDDVMSHRAVMACWIDFKTDQGLPETLTRIDKHSAYFQKIVDTRIDPTKQHPPQDVNKK